MIQLFGLQPADLVLVFLLLLILNALTFVVYGIDKWRAQGGHWRIPERMSRHSFSWLPSVEP